MDLPFLWKWGDKNPKKYLLRANSCFMIYRIMIQKNVNCDWKIKINCLMLSTNDRWDMLVSNIICHESHFSFTHKGLMRNLIITGQIACKGLCVTTVMIVSVCQRCYLQLILFSLSYSWCLRKDHMELDHGHKMGLLISRLWEAISSNVQLVGRFTYIEVA